jgi:hypothetical protein
MWRYLITLTFHDIWDNFIFVLGFNLLVFGLTGLGLLFIFLIPGIFSASIVIFFYTVILSVLSVLFIVKTGGKVKYFMQQIMPVSVFSILNTLIIFTGIYSFYFYSNQTGIIINTFKFAIFWIILFWSLIPFFYVVSQDYFTGRNKDFKPSKLFIESFGLSSRIFFSESITIFTGAIIYLILVITTPVFILGLGAALIWKKNLFYLIEKKYKWLETHQDLNSGKKVKWRIILQDELENLSERTFRNFIFPWK